MLPRHWSRNETTAAHRVWPVGVELLTWGILSRWATRSVDHTPRAVFSLRPRSLKLRRYDISRHTALLPWVICPFATLPPAAGCGWTRFN